MWQTGSLTVRRHVPFPRHAVARHARVRVDPSEGSTPSAKELARSDRATLSASRLKRGLQPELGSASGLHPPAILLAVKLWPDLEETAAGGPGSHSVMLDQFRGERDQSGIAGVVIQCALELARGDRARPDVRRERPGRGSSTG